MRGFHQGLKETGYVESDNVTIVYRFAENQLSDEHMTACDSKRWSSGPRCSDKPRNIDDGGAGAGPSLGAQARVD